jgi:hypothetical protein
MLSINPFTIYNIVDILNKPLYFIESDQLNVCNLISPDDLGFFQEYYGNYYTEIVYYEYERLTCPMCDISMNSNGSRPAKPNKWEDIRKKQYICPECGKTQFTSLENFIKKYSNYTRAICEKSLEYESITYMSYQKKAEIIKLENGIRLNRQTVYYHESTYDESFITLKEENLKKLLKECKIEPSGIYHYDEEFLHENGINTVRLAIIDAVTNLIINDQIIYQEDFNQDFVEIFLKYSLEGFPKKVLITDGHIMYPSIIERICIKQQLCIFHIIKYHNDKSYKKMNKIQRRIKTLKTKIKQNEERIKELKEYTKGKIGNVSKKDKTRKRRINKRKKLEKDNRRYRKELKQKRKELIEQEQINERIANIYNTDTEKAAIRRFKTIYHQLDQFDDNTQKFLKNLNNKFDKTTEYYKNPLIPRTNNKIEGYFKITLPRQLKRIYRTREGLIRWIRLQKIRWTEKNVLYNETNSQNHINNQKIGVTS